MIVTVTPNPSLDRTLELSCLVRGSVNRASGGRVDAGGKGVNVSRALAGHGVKSAAVVPLGGSDGDHLADLLAGSGVDVRTVRIAGETRTNVTVAEPDGTTTKLNEPGPELSPAELDDLLVAVLEVATPGSWVVCSGSLSRGADPAFYARLVGPLHDRGARVAVDSSGAPLRAVLAAGRGHDRPDLIKPNHAELADAVGRRLPTLGDVVAAARELRVDGAPTVLVSLGADGAVLVDDDGAVHGEAFIDDPRSTVGAGDSFLAGFLSARAAAEPAPPVASLRTALAWGAAATRLPGSQMPSPADVAAVPVTIHPAVELDRSIAEDHHV